MRADIRLVRINICNTPVLPLTIPLSMYPRFTLTVRRTRTRTRYCSSPTIYTATQAYSI